MRLGDIFEKLAALDVRKIASWYGAIGILIIMFTALMWCIYVMWTVNPIFGVGGFILVTSLLAIMVGD